MERKEYLRNCVRWGVVAIIFGTLMTVVVAWGCAMWSGERFSIGGGDDGGEDIGAWAEMRCPDGYVGIAYARGGIGWEQVAPYSGERHYGLAGWPLRAMWSRLVMMDDDWSGVPARGLTEGDRFYRGVAARDFPGWMRVERDRSLPLVPLGWGFAGDVAFYGVGFLLLARGWRVMRARVRRRRRGFPVMVVIRGVVQ